MRRFTLNELSNIERMQEHSRDIIREITETIWREMIKIALHGDSATNRELARGATLILEDIVTALENPKDLIERNEYRREDTTESN